MKWWLDEVFGIVHNPIFDSLNARKRSVYAETSHFKMCKNVAIYYFFFPLLIRIAFFIDMSESIS